MDTRYIFSARRRARGAARPVVLAVVVVFVLLALAAWLLIFRPHEELVAQGAGTVNPSTPVVASHVAAPPMNVEAMSVNELLAEAAQALKEQRYLAPAGNNAFEFYLRVLQKQPGNQVASQALRETFPFAASAAEQTINQRNFDEAEREIDLLAKADPSNFTLTILRSKLDAQRKTLDQQQQQQLDQEHQQQLAAQKAAKAAAAEKLAEQQPQPIVTEPAAVAAQERPRRAIAPTVQQHASEQVAKAPASTGVTRDAILTHQVNPRYPTSAARAGIQGWVDVMFTVDVDGKVRDAKVIDAQPGHVFDYVALEAVRRWEFEPAMRNGQPVTQRLKRRILFKLAGGL